MESSSLANTLEVLKTIVDLELSLAEFYRFCSGVREGEKDFWLTLEQDEEKHARKIGEMARRIEEGQSLLVPNASFNAAPLHNLKNFIAKSMKRLQHSQIPTDFKTLVSIAWNIEYSILEIKYNDLFSIAEQGYEESMQTILSETASHRGKLGSRITALRSSHAKTNNRASPKPQSRAKRKIIPKGQPLKLDKPLLP
jgi:rubrerythrin